MYCPVATPGGMLSMIVCSSRSRPSPRHLLHGDVTTTPSPAHVGQGATLTNWPKKDRCARRTSPVPPHVVHRCGFVPGSAPLPEHRSHGSSSFTVTLFSAP